MSDLFDYLEWRGDLTFEKEPFHLVDALIFGQFSYLTAENVMEDKESISIAQLWERLKDGPVSGRYHEKSDRKLLEALALSERYRDLKIVHPVSRQDEEQMIQFAALTVLLPDGTPYLSFRGTDLSIVGWKEDFYLALPEAVPAQFCAENYLEEIVRRYERPVLLGGHSKGGNLALYAAAAAGEEVQKYVKTVYIFDGPGLTRELFASEGYERIRDRLVTFLPEQSMVGILMMHPEEYSIVKSNGSGIAQHDTFNWQVNKRGLELAPELKSESLYMETVVRKWLEETSEEELKSLIDTLFEMLDTSDALSFDELVKQIRKHPKLVFQAIREVDEETHRAVLQTVGNMAETAIHEAASEIRMKGKDLTRRSARQLRDLLPIETQDTMER